jgi:hypothetical protein
MLCLDAWFPSCGCFASRRLGASFPQHLNLRVTVDQFASLSLSQPFLEYGRRWLHAAQHPVFQIELLANARG